MRQNLNEYLETLNLASTQFYDLPGIKVNFKEKVKYPMTDDYGILGQCFQSLQFVSYFILIFLL